MNNNYEVTLKDGLFGINGIVWSGNDIAGKFGQYTDGKFWVSTDLGFCQKVFDYQSEAVEFITQKWDAWTRNSREMAEYQIAKFAA